MLPDFCRHIKGAGHGRFASGRCEAHQLGIFWIHIGDSANLACGYVPSRYEQSEENKREDASAERQIGRHVFALLF
jgi:hypothetical protein